MFVYDVEIKKISIWYIHYIVFLLWTEFWNNFDKGQLVEIELIKAPYSWVELPPPISQNVCSQQGMTDISS